MSLQVQGKQCVTCIYKRSDLFNVKELEAEVADPRMRGHFKMYRRCHHSDSACCRGFWDRHKDHFDQGQLAQRLGVVVFVDHDTCQLTVEEKPL